ncbi:MAG: DUF5661 family protein [Phycisphaerae bacterium]|jgi:hypothetical protein
MPQAIDYKPLNPGGTAEKHPHMQVSAAEIRKGTKVEMEHTDKPQKATATAVDHDVEIPDYYERLEEMENEAEAEGVKRADHLLRQLERLPSQHQEELDAATEEANNSLARQQVLGEIGAGVGSAFSAIPGVGLLLPSHNELRNDMRSALEAQAEEHAQNLGALQAQHADQATQLMNRLRARAGKVAIDLTQTATQMAAAPRGDELHLPMGEDPYAGDQKASADYENGFSYAQALGHQMLNQATEGDIQRWQGNEQPWRDGFAAACEKFGLARVGNLVAGEPKMAEVLPKTKKGVTVLPDGSGFFTATVKSAEIPSADTPGGHWSRGAGAVLGAGAGIAAHSLWGDPGELYTLVPPALAGVAAGTIAGDLGHSLAQRSSTPEAAPIEGTDDPRVRTPQALAALAGMGLGAGLGYLGGHHLAPESWHHTPGGFAPELAGTAVGGVGGAMAGSALEDRLAGRDKRAHYTQLIAEEPMTSIAPMSADELKTANALYPLLGALGGAAAGSMAGPHIHQLGDFIQAHHQGAPQPSFDESGMDLQHSPNEPAPEAPAASQLSPEELAHLEKLYGAGIGGAAGLAGGMAANAMSGREEPRHFAPQMYRTAAVLTDIDSDLEGSALDVLDAKVASLGTTLGTLAGIGGGALAGNYLAPAMHWAAMPSEHAGLEQAIGSEVQPQIDAAVHGGGGIHADVSPEQLAGLRSGLEAGRGAEWQGISNLGRVLGAGAGGVAGYQAGRGLDEAFGLEKRERPLVVAPMARPTGY